MLTLNGIDIKMPNPEPQIFDYVSSYYDIDSLLEKINLTLRGYRIFGKENNGNKIKAILMCTLENDSLLKYKTFTFKDEEFEKHYKELFLGFDDMDIKIAICKFISIETEKIKIKEI